MAYKLYIVDGEAKGTEIEITPPTVLGRSKQADVTLGHSLISRRHCEITLHEDGLLVVEDLGSLNGTFHGEEQINEPVYLEPGDRIVVGGITLEARYGDFTPQAEPEMVAEPSADSAESTELDFLGGEATEETEKTGPSEEPPEALDFVADQPASEEPVDAKPAEDEEKIEFAEQAEDESPAEAEQQDADEPVDFASIVEDALTDEPANEVPQATDAQQEAAEPAEETPAAGAKDQAATPEGDDFSWLGGSGETSEPAAGQSDKDLGDFLKSLD